MTDKDDMSDAIARLADIAAALQPGLERGLKLEAATAAQIKALARDAHILRRQMKEMIEHAAIATLPQDPRVLGRYPGHLFSQGYEDAILCEIVARIGNGTRRFLEIGCGHGGTSCTRILHLLGWTGVWIDGDAASLDLARKMMAPAVAQGQIEIVTALLSAENVNDTVQATSIGTGGVDVLSLDIDFNTSHVWAALTTPARAACIEYNANFAPVIDYEVPYDATGTFDGTVLFGASLKALERIGRAKGMALVGCDIHGLNGYFVAEGDLGDCFLQPYTAERHYQPLRMSSLGVRAHAHPVPPRAQGAVAS